MQQIQRLAVEAVTAVLQGKSLPAVLERLAGEQPLAASQRPALLDITHGTLRHLGLLRALTALMLRKPQQKARQTIVVVRGHQRVEVPAP